MAILNSYTYTCPGTIEAGFVVVFKAADFPAGMLDGGANGFTAEAGNAQAYTDDGLGTRLPIHVVRCVVGGIPDVKIHVRHPTGGTGATIHWVADSVQTVQPAFGAQYGRNEAWQDYVAGWHLQESLSTAAGHYIDSTGNGWDGTLIGAGVTRSDSVSGMERMGGALVGDGAADQTVNTNLRVGNVGPETVGRMTVWLSPTAGDFILGQYSSSQAYAVGRLGGKLYSRIAGGYVVDAAVTIPDSAATRISLVMDGTGTARPYVNGVATGTYSHSTSPFLGTGGAYVGLLDLPGATGYEINGAVAYVAYDKIPRSAAFESAEYDNQSATGAWGTVGPLIPAGGGGGEYLSALSPDLDIFAGVTLGLSAGSITILAPDADDSQAQILALSSGLSAAITSYQDTSAQQGMLIATGYSATSSPLLGLSEGQSLILASGYTAFLATDDDAVAYPATVLVTGDGEPSYIAVMLPLEQTSQAQALSASLGYTAQQAELSGTSAVITINLSGGGSFGLSPDSDAAGFATLGVSSGAIFTMAADSDAASYPATTILTGVVIGKFTASGVIDVSPSYGSVEVTKAYGVIDVTQTYGTIVS